MKCSTFALTIRPRNGVTDSMISTIVNWIKSRCLYYLIVTEKLDSARHVHAGIVLKKEVTRSNLCMSLSRLLNDSLDHEERRVFLSGIKIMYNDDWINNYLNKDDDTVIIESSLPEAGFLESYYPVQETTTRKPRCSAYYVNLERLWYENKIPGTEVNTLVVRDFLFELMYNKRVIDIIRDDKGIVQVARHLVRFLKKATESTIELAPFEKEE